MNSSSSSAAISILILGNLFFLKFLQLRFEIAIHTAVELHFLLRALLIFALAQIVKEKFVALRFPWIVMDNRF